MRYRIRIVSVLLPAVLMAAPIAAQQQQLLASSVAGVTYFDNYRRARELYDARQFGAAEVVLSDLTRQAPADGMVWFLLGRARQRVGNVRGAIAAYRSSVERGNRSEVSTAYQIARLYTELGEVDSALSGSNAQSRRDGMTVRDSRQTVHSRLSAAMPASLVSPAYRRNRLPLAKRVGVVTSNTWWRKRSACTPVPRGRRTRVSSIHWRRR